MPRTAPPTNNRPSTTIDEIRLRPLPHPRLQQLLVDVVASDGTIGTGECWWGIGGGGAVNPFAPHAAAVELLAHRCVGRPSGNIERLTTTLLDWSYRYGDGGIITGAISGIDLALWDLLGKQLDVPVNQLLGGNVSERLPVYASLPPFGDADQVIAESRRAIASGFRAVKLHERDASIIAATREGLGPDVVMMVDVNGHFDVHGAIDFGRRIASTNVLWFEEPVRPMRHVDALSTVARNQPVPLAAGENEYSLTDFDRLLRGGGVRWVQPEITKIGGLSVARKIGAIAELHAVALCPHNFRSGPSLRASIQWGFASGGTAWLELPWLPADVEFPSSEALPVVDDGTIDPPRGPGL